MFSLSICFGPQGTVWSLLYKEEEKAASLYNSFTSGKVEGSAGCFVAADDFGQALTLDFKTVHAMLLEDLDLSQQGQIERAVHNARSQAKAQQRAMSDPTIKTAAMAQGPAVHSPFPNGRFNG